MPSQGWIKLHRGLLDHWVMNDPFIFTLWARLLLMANYTSKKILLGRDVFDAPAGEVYTSERKLSEVMGCSRQKIRNALKALEKDKMITIKKDHQKTVISICNFTSYQSAISKEKPQEDHCETTHNIRKKYKKEKIYNQAPAHAHAHEAENITHTPCDDLRAGPDPETIQAIFKKCFPSESHNRPSQTDVNKCFANWIDCADLPSENKTSETFLRYVEWLVLEKIKTSPELRGQGKLKNLKITAVKLMQQSAKGWWWERISCGEFDDNSYVEN